MKKKTAAMVLAALMAFSMTACGNDSTQKEDDSTAADQETTEATETADNTVADDTASGDEAVELHWLNKCESDVEAQIWQQVADLVHEKYPNITVTVENTDWTSYWTKLPVELASGNAPDLLYMHFSRASDYTNSMLPISDYIEKDEDINIDDFYSGILDSFIFDDQVYALPYDFGPYIMYYNKDLFDKYGEYPDENTTWEEFKDKCKQLTQDGNYGTVFASSLDYYDPQVLSLGGEIINEKGEFDITGDKTTAALQSLADLINVDKVAPKIADTANTVWNWEQFEGGNIGMLIDGPWTVTNVVNYCDFNVGYSIIPKAEKHLHGEVVSFGVLCLLTYDNQLEERERIMKFHKTIGLPTCLADMEITEEDIPAIVEKASTVREWSCVPYATDKDKFAKAILETDKVGKTF